jgi:hypothetical protein
MPRPVRLLARRTNAVGQLSANRRPTLMRDPASPADAGAPADAVATDADRIEYLATDTTQQVFKALYPQSGDQSNCPALASAMEGGSASSTHFPTEAG